MKDSAMKWVAAILAATMIGPALLRPVEAQQVQVDLALVLAVDVSSSMNRDELRLQRAGYVAAIADPLVADAMRSGYFHRIGLSYFEWSDPDHQVVIMPWRLIDGLAAARAFADELAAQPLTGGTNTAISSGLLFAQDLLLRAPFLADRQVIDVSGDGPNTAGPHIAPVRDRVVADGIVINGLPVLIGLADQGALNADTLTDYYRDCVTGGPGSFVVPVSRSEGVVQAIRRKLVLEIAGSEPKIILAGVVGTDSVDCTLGQKDFYE